MANNMRVQSDLLKRMQRARENFKKSPKERLLSEDHLKLKLKMLEDLWAQFHLTHTQIVLDTDPPVLESSAYVTGDLYGTTEEFFLEYSFEIKSALNKLQIKSHSPANVTSETGPTTSNIRLPKITIPVFSGKYSEWTTFHDLFISLIHNNKTLDDVQRLHYLKSHLVGEAEQLVRHVNITQENYQTCWEQLKKRYNNKKYLANHILKRLLSQRNLTSESANALKELLDTTNECLHALENIGVDVSSWDIIVIHIICLKLDSETRKQWELKSSELSEDLPTLKQFYGFLETRFRALEFVEPKSAKNVPSFSNKGFNSYASKGSNAAPNPKVHHVTTLSCSYCSDNHKIINCKGFAKIDIDARRDFVQSNRLCFNCLGVNHSVFACRQSTRCRICNKKHHSLLHPKNTTPAADSEVSSQSAERSMAVLTASTSSSSHDEPTCGHVMNHFSTSRNQVLLATALVKAQSKNGSKITLRCLLDQGSQASLITESAVQLLGLRKIQHKSTISGLGSDEGAPLASKAMVNVNIQSLLDPKCEFSVNAFVLNKLTSVLPERRIVVELWSEFNNIELADPSFNKPNKIDLLLGADVYGRILEDGIIKGSSGAIVAQKTSLGWILSGPIHAPDSSEHYNISVNHVQVNENELLKRFWELESDIPVKSPNENYTEEERKCEEIFNATTKRDGTGRYIVKLPFRNEDPDCKYGQSESIATRRFMQLEKRFARDPQLQARYTEVIDEYLELGHMERITEKERHQPNVVYLPHHAVIREDKTTSKVRVVFDASCPGINGVSLNQDLLVGPALQADLRHTILRWRVHPICLVADIVKMYRQVKVDETDADFQRIVWRANSQDEIGHFKLLRVTFGTASAPYLAVRALHQVAYDEGANVPLAAERVLNHFYMDDLLTGCQTVEEGRKIHKELIELLAKGGFELQKWTTNNKELMKEIEKENVEITENVQLEVDTVMKILGLTWNRNTDEFEYAVQLSPPKTPLTKRNVISDIARLFDPLGWLAPVIITAKIFIQKLWLSGIDWDQEVPELLLMEWLAYRENLAQLTKFKVPRWIRSSAGDDTLELQGFCDASSDAYAAVVYARVIDSNGDVHVSLLTAKTKVAPIKQISIPRLELCGAVLLTRLLIEVADVMGIDKMKIHAWTDSTIVLSWLNSRPNRWKTFVANRVSEIITSMEPEQWSHVVSKDNPADCASRGTYQSVDELLWKQGPAWLKEKSINYKNVKIKETKLEEKRTKLCLIHTCGTAEERVSSGTEVMSRFSNLRRMIRVLTLCKRFIKRCRGQVFNKWLTSQELQDTLMVCIKLTQAEHFAEEMSSLKQKKAVTKKSKLTSVNPTLDADGILRVGGRLQHAQISEEMKHPIILPHKSPLTDLIVADAHQRTLHGAPQLMLNYLRSKYWILGAKNMVIEHVPVCFCPEGYTGNAAIEDCKVFEPVPANDDQTEGPDMTEESANAEESVKTIPSEHEPGEVRDICHPSPCGPNATCTIFLGLALCRYLIPPAELRTTTSKPENECESDDECDLLFACRDYKCISPCRNCGENAMCTKSNHSAICKCPRGHTGDPYDKCSPECEEDDNCPSTKPTCVDNSCVDPCDGACGINARCAYQGESTICSCPSYTSGDALVFCRPSDNSVDNFCDPNPCGANATCTLSSEYYAGYDTDNSTDGDYPVCTCPDGYAGNPRTYCELSECDEDSACDDSLACIYNECVDPCLDDDSVCGEGAVCESRLHLALCSCLEGEYGDPFTRCYGGGGGGGGGGHGGLSSAVIASLLG